MVALTGGLRLYGGYRTWSGGYQVTLDNGPPQSFLGYTGGPESFDRLLFAASGLADGPHQIRVASDAQDATHPILDFESVSAALSRCRDRVV